MCHVAAQLVKFPPLQPATIAAGCRAGDAAIRFDLAKAVVAAHDCASGREAPRSAGEAAGLVPYKTSFYSSSEISFSKTLVAERRVNRLKKSVWASGHLHGMADKGFRPSVAWFVTLTYAKAGAWCPKHISEALKGFRSWCMGKGVPCRYTWVAEIQPKRLESTGDAVVHYHLLAWLPVGVSMPQWDRITRKDRGVRPAFWQHGMTNTEKAFSGVGYLMKYLSKLGELTVFPKGLRLYGIGGLDASGKSVRRWFNLPAWVKQVSGVGDVSKVGNFFVMRDSGEVLESPWRCVKTQFGMVITALRPIPERWFDGAYSSVQFV